jgi:hypothetical protein
MEGVVHLVNFPAIGYILWSSGIYLWPSGIFCGHLVYFVVIWYILWSSGIFCGHLVHMFYCQLVYFSAIWYMFVLFGKFCGHPVNIFPFLVCCTKKNLATLVVVPRQFLPARANCRSKCDNSAIFSDRMRRNRKRVYFRFFFKCQIQIFFASERFSKGIEI